MAFLTQCIKGGSRDSRPGWLISFTYEEEIVEFLKRGIPHTEREWRYEEKVWWVSEIYIDHLKRTFSNFEALAFLQGKLL